MNKKTRLFCLLTLSFFGCSTGYGQNTTPQKDTLIKATVPGNLSNRVFISCDSKVKYLVSYDEQNWHNSTIYSISSPDSWKMDRDFYIKVMTQTKKPVIYKLTANNYYSIAWDDKNGLWDVYHINK